MKKKFIVPLCLLSICIFSTYSSAGLKDKIKNAKDKTLIKTGIKDEKKKPQVLPEVKPEENPKKEEAVNVDNTAKIAELEKQLASLQQPKGLTSEIKASKLKETPVSGTKNESKEQGKAIDGSPVTYITTTERFKASAAFDQQIMLNPGKDVIYPGVVLLGHTIADETYQEVTKGTRRPITISYDITDAKKRGTETDGEVAGTYVPSLSEYRKLHNKILGQDISGVSSIWSFEETKVYSESDFAIKFNMGVGYNTGLVETNVSNGFNFEKGNKKNKYMIKFMRHSTPWMSTRGRTLSFMRNSI